MKEKKEGIVIIDENTIYEIDTECMVRYQEKDRSWEQKKEETEKKKKTGWE